MPVQLHPDGPGTHQPEQEGLFGNRHSAITRRKATGGNIAIRPGPLVQKFMGPIAQGLQERHAGGVQKEGLENLPLPVQVAAGLLQLRTEGADDGSHVPDVQVAFV